MYDVNVYDVIIYDINVYDVIVYDVNVKLSVRSLRFT